MPLCQKIPRSAHPGESLLGIWKRQSSTLIPQNVFSFKSFSRFSPFDCYLCPFDVVPIWLYIGLILWNCEFVEFLPDLLLTQQGYSTFNKMCLFLPIDNLIAPL